MIAIITVLAAFPLGYFLRSRLAASVAYGLAYLWAFTFQTLYLLLDSLHGGADPAFTTYTFPWEYGIVALAVIAAGFGLLNLGHWVRRRLTTRRSAATQTARPA